MTGLEGQLFWWVLSHDFAKAYFGEEALYTKHRHKPDGNYDCAHCHKSCDVAWEYYITELALTPPEERLSYLERYL